MLKYLIYSALCFYLPVLHSQSLHTYKDSVVLVNSQVHLTIHLSTGKTDYRFSNGISLYNTVAYVEDLHAGFLSTADPGLHAYSIAHISDTLGSGVRINIRHIGKGRPLYLLQHITLYADQPYILIDVQAGRNKNEGPLPETRNIAPLAILPSCQGRLVVPGHEPRILDVPFDNDGWVGVAERAPGASCLAGTSYEFCSAYDYTTMSGFVAGSVAHDFWKTGIDYRMTETKGVIDSFNIFGGAATPDNPSLPPACGGRDGTHDFVPHGTLRGITIQSPLVYLCALKDVRKAFTGFGEVNARLNGRLSWKGAAPFYWNSFGVEDVLGYRKVMMPAAVKEIADFITTLDQFNSYAKPVLSIDSYDQSIYSTDTLAELGRYADMHRQQLGFYFIPFAVWTWKNGITEHKKLPGTSYDLPEVLLRDRDNKPLPYKDGDFAAFALDPTHPAVRQLLIEQLLKAKTIHARFLKIDFLTAGALESVHHYDASVRSGIQAYNFGMKMLKHLVDSILGPDIFITQAISPMFPHQYAHARFNSTDVYSHLRDDQPGFPNWGSTEASLATGSHLWWVQGTLLPFNNLDVAIMKNFQRNPDLGEQEIKVRMYAMMVMGSILGDGSDFRQPLAMERAKRFLNNKALCAFFSRPKAFTPIKFADGDGFDQQLSFFLKAGSDSPTLLALFNFSNGQEFNASFRLEDLGMESGQYNILDFMTDRPLGVIKKGQTVFSLTVPVKDAYLVKLQAVKPR